MTLAGGRNISPAGVVAATGVTHLHRPALASPVSHLFFATRIFSTTSRIFLISAKITGPCPLDWDDSSIIYLALAHAKCQHFS